MRDFPGAECRDPQRDCEVRDTVAVAVALQFPGNSRIGVEARVMRSTVLVLQALLSLAGLARAAAPVPPSVVFVEIGNRGTVYPPNPVLVDVKLHATEAFEGALEVSLVTTGDVEWRGFNVFEIARAVYNFTTPAGQTLPIRIVLPSTKHSVLENHNAALRWRLVDASNRNVLNGREALGLAPGLGWRDGPRVLAIGSTATDRENTRRAEEAFDAIVQYEPFTHTTIHSRDLDRLSDRQLEVLFDAVALGMTLIVSGTEGALARFGIEPATRGEVIWRSRTNGTLWEVPLGLGLVRLVTVDDFNATGASGILRSYLLSQRPLSATRRLATAPNTDEPGYWSPRYAEPPADAVDPGKVWLNRIRVHGLLAAAVGLLFLMIVSVPLRNIRKHPEPSSGAWLVRLIGLSLVSPWAIYVLLVQFPAGNLDHEHRLLLHDSSTDRTVDVSWGSIGGGGGTRAVDFRYRLDHRSVLRSPTLRDFIYQTTTGIDDCSKLSVPFSRSSSHRAVSYNLARVSDSERAWDSDLEWRRDGTLGGRLTARRDLGRALLLIGRRTFRLGNIARGATIEADFILDAMTRDAQSELTGEEYGLLVDAWDAVLERSWWRTNAGRLMGDLAVIALDLGTMTGRPFDEPVRVFQPVSIGGGGAVPGLVALAPVRYVVEGPTVTLDIPTVLVDSLSPGEFFDIVTRYDTTGPSAAARDALESLEATPGSVLSHGRSDGFVSYRLNVVPTPIWEDHEGFMHISWRQRGRP